MRPLIRILTGTLFVGLLLGVGALSAALTDPSSVNIDNFTFAPAEITVAPGTKVTWTNRDDIPHIVTDAAEPRGFKSPPLDTGNTFSYVFTKTGTYHYFCSLHPRMQGTVVVK